VPGLNVYNAKARKINYTQAYGARLVAGVNIGVGDCATVIAVAMV
jgi:hypothetical protein